MGCMAWGWYGAYLVVDLPLWKMMDFVKWEKLVFPIFGKIIQMFQTTNQLWVSECKHNKACFCKSVWVWTLWYSTGISKDEWGCYLYCMYLCIYISRTFQNKKIQKAPTRPSQSKSSCWISTCIPEILQVSAAQSSWERMLKQQHGNAAANLRRKTAPHFRKKKVWWLLHSHTNLPTYFGKRISKHGVRQKT